MKTPKAQALLILRAYNMKCAEAASLRKRLEEALDSNRRIEEQNIGFKEEILTLEELLEAAKEVALAIGDRTHGAMASECNEWRERLEQAALAGEEKV
jgi:hypothetical protein